MSYQHQPINLPRQLQGRQIETSLLGKGSFGKIYLIKDANKLSVLKEISINHLSEQDKKKAMSEATILSQLNHPNICSFIDSFVGEPYGEHLYIIMEYADGGDLRKLIKNNKMMSIVSTEEEVKNICRQCSLGLKHIHDVGIIHRDIKSENIFLHNKGSLVKLGDFGISKVLDRSNGFADTMVGTPYYFSPELCENKPYGKKSGTYLVTKILKMVKVHLRKMFIIFHITFSLFPIPFNHDFSQNNARHLGSWLCVLRTFKARSTIQR